MSTAKKKPVALSDSLLTNRPRKGDAKPQSESSAATPTPQIQTQVKEIAPAANVDRRRRRAKSTSRNTESISMRVRPEILERFYDFIDSQDMTLAQGLEALLDEAGK